MLNENKVFIGICIRSNYRTTSFEHNVCIFRPFYYVKVNFICV